MVIELDVSDDPDHPYKWEDKRERGHRIVFISSEMKQKHAETIESVFLDCALQHTALFIQHLCAEVLPLVQNLVGRGWNGRLTSIKMWNSSSLQDGTTNGNRTALLSHIHPFVNPVSCGNASCAACFQFSVRRQRRQCSHARVSDLSHCALCG